MKTCVFWQQGELHRGLVWVSGLARGKYTQTVYITSSFTHIHCFLNAVMIPPQCFLIIRNTPILYVYFLDGRS